MADYATPQAVKDMLGGNWGPDQPTGSGSSRDAVLATLVTRCSRMFDRATGKGTNFYAPAVGAVRYFSGSGNQWQEIDDFQSFSLVQMSSNQSRSDAVTLSLTDPTSANYVTPYPLLGPPYSQLFLLRGWLPDAYNVGNIIVTGTLITPEEVTHAIAIWAAYEYKRVQAGWQDAGSPVDSAHHQPYGRTMPAEVAKIIEWYRDNRKGPQLALVGATTDRISPWLGWRT